VDEIVGDEVSATLLPKVRGKLTPDAPLAPLVWFKSGGTAEWLFEPADVADLCDFLAQLDPVVPVMALGLGSNLIVRDGGVPGVVVRLGKAFAKVQAEGETLTCGGGASGILVSSTARDAGVAGVEFLRSIPGTVGGFVRMNGGAYGRETKDVLVDCEVVLRSGERVTLPVAALGYTYRHSELPEGAIVVSRVSLPRFRWRWTASAPRARRRSRCAARRGDPRSRTPRATRRGGWSMRRAVAASRAVGRR
jgi:UDP-N-acetylmuramate dehydrogenase